MLCFFAQDEVHNQGSVASVCSGSTDPVPLGASVVRLGVLGARCRATAPQRRARGRGRGREGEPWFCGTRRGGFRA
jgi:hypothetical protein